jgi:hypothetical protein
VTFLESTSPSTTTSMISHKVSRELDPATYPNGLLRVTKRGSVMTEVYSQNKKMSFSRT